ncbi:hypothetical protein QTO34_019305 [Cnephaeus nilssonii]|uniref:Uncharacterized protein n=1 Tax=Cnephaeus nilssonii TaxID=3371016 RepID=A0AA40HWA4_CNENI|nr:hypothetical protein QTO34_019305 [Eptesicus nilssonii]
MGVPEEEREQDTENLFEEIMTENFSHLCGGKGAGKRIKWRQAPCRNKKEQKEFLQWESEWLDLMNAELKTQMEELKQERQQLI